MKKIIIAIVVILILGIGGYFIIKGSSNNNPQQQPLKITIYCANNNCSAQQIAAGAGTLVKGCYRNLSDCTSDMNSVASTTSQITIKNFSFSPSPLNIKVGTTVIWTNQDNVLHHIKSATFESGDLGQGQSFQFTFTAVGTYDYICKIHTSMKGQIIVSQ
jgi:plastocyanin